MNMVKALRHLTPEEKSVAVMALRLFCDSKHRDASQATLPFINVKDVLEALVNLSGSHIAAAIRAKIRDASGLQRKHFTTFMWLNEEKLIKRFGKNLHRSIVMTWLAPKITKRKRRAFERTCDAVDVTYPVVDLHKHRKDGSWRVQTQEIHAEAVVNWLRTYCCPSGMKQRYKRGK